MKLSASSVLLKMHFSLYSMYALLSACLVRLPSSLPDHKGIVPISRSVMSVTNWGL